MEVFKVACPKCSATLKSAKAIPPGSQLKCPKCATLFRTAAAAAAAVPAAIRAGSAPQPTAVRAEGRPATVEPALQTPPTTSATPTPSSNLVPMIVAVALVVLIGVGGGLLWFCFKPDASTPTPVAKSVDDDEEPTSNPVTIFDEPDPTFTPLPPRPLVPLSKEDEDKVNLMVSRGVSYLKKTQKANGSWPSKFEVEAAAMAGLTLLECGIPPDDPAIVKAAEFVRKNIPTINRTYGLSLYILFLDRLGDPVDKDTLLKLALRLMAGQAPSGGWAYVCPVLSDRDTVKMTAVLREMETRPIAEVRTGQAWKELPASLHRLPCFLDGQITGAGGDNSNTQFAMLALWAARRTKVPVEPSLRLVAKHFRTTQNSNGGWPYRNGAGSTTTMSCAGLLGLAIDMGLKENQTLSARNDPAITKGITFVSQVLVPSAKGVPKPSLYLLWSIERVAMLYQLAKFNDKEWYQWGMRMLHVHQKADGSWVGASDHGAGPVPETCFALLFLQRVNLAQDLTDKIKGLLNELSLLDIVDDRRGS